MVSFTNNKRLSEYVQAFKCIINDFTTAIYQFFILIRNVLQSRYLKPVQINLRHSGIYVGTQVENCGFRDFSADSLYLHTLLVNGVGFRFLIDRSLFSVIFLHKFPNACCFLVWKLFSHNVQKKSIFWYSNICGFMNFTAKISMFSQKLIMNYQVASF